MLLTKKNVEEIFDRIKDHLAEHKVTAEFVDIDYNYYGHTQLQGPVVTYKSNDSKMDWFIQVKIESEFPGVIGVVRVSQ